MGRKRNIPLWPLTALPIGAVLLAYAVAHPDALTTLGHKTTSVEQRLAAEAAKFKGMVNPHTQVPYDIDAIERRLHRIRERLLDEGTKPVYFGG